MPDAYLIVGLVVILALVFDFINGFHDTANAIATVVSTRVLSPRVAIIMAAVLNVVGALVSTNVAKTIAGGLVKSGGATQTVILSAIVGAIVWNLITWKYGIPSSSSHALIGGIVGAALIHGGVKNILVGGVIQKVIIPLFTSPLVGFVLGFILMQTIFKLFARWHPGRVNTTFKKLQIVSAAWMAFNHGMSDAQKSMGIITMALVTGKFIHAADPTKPHVPLWVILTCAITMGLGTSAGGWRIIKTMGHRIIRLEPVHGFAAEMTASMILFITSRYAMPVSTTHVISGSIFGVGASKRLSAVRWGVAQTMLMAWILTIPASGIIAALTYGALNLLIK